MGRILSGWTTAISALHLKLESGGFSKGPATYLFFTQSAIVSVISFPWISADFAFLQRIGGRLISVNEIAPVDRIFRALFAILFSYGFHSFSCFLIKILNLSTFTGVHGPVGKLLLGKVFQKHAPGSSL
jgi:hypothetical protein